MVKKLPDLATIEDCTGCLACVDACDFKALDSYLAFDGHLYVKCDLKICTQCSKCSKACPIVTKYSHESVLKISKPFASWANDDELRIKSASGGVFAALAYNVLTIGGFVVGATMDGLTVKHIMIDSTVDIHKLQGSKYLQSDTTGIYKNVYSKLKGGSTVLYSGLPCQVAGLFAFIGNRKFNGKLYTTDLVCAGVPSKLLLNSYIKNNTPHTKSIISFRDKRNGWKSNDLKFSLMINTTKDTTYTDENSFLIYGFASGLTNRSSCSKCEFTYLHRKSDLTLSDFHGLKEYPEEHFMGVSLVVSHTAHGEKLLRTSNLTNHPTTWDKCLPYNPRMVVGSRFLYRHHPARFFMQYLFKRCNYETLEKIYGRKYISKKNILSKKNIPWLPYKILDFVINKISKKIQNKNVHNVLKDIDNKNSKC